MTQLIQTIVTMYSSINYLFLYLNHVFLLLSCNLPLFFILCIITYLQLPLSLILLSSSLSLSLSFWSLFPPSLPPLSPPALLFVFALSPARCLSLSDKERFILSASADCYVKIWALSIGMIYCINMYMHSYVSLNIKIDEASGLCRKGVCVFAL